MRIMVLHIELKKVPRILREYRLVRLFPISRWFLRPQFNDEFPLSTESILGHASILYVQAFKTPGCGQLAIARH